MRVAQLIAELQQIDQELDVVFSDGGLVSFVGVDLGDAVLY